MRTHVIAASAGTRFDEMRAAMKEYGSHSLAHSTLQADMKYHSCQSGYLAYRVINGGQTIAVLGDPVCAPHDLEECLVGFLDIHPGAIFLQISTATARVLQKLGLYINTLGRECWLDLNPAPRSSVEPFTTAGRIYERLRTTRNRCRREGIRIEEMELDEINPSVLVDISREWLKTKRVSSELTFLARPLANEPITQSDSPNVEDLYLQHAPG